MKQFIRETFILNYYRFRIYKITDAKGRVLYNAEPVNGGVTRASDNEAGLITQLVEDCKFMNWLHKKESEKKRFYRGKQK